ncbi:MAG: hypothetical protein AB1414_20865 [bacterium]
MTLTNLQNGDFTTLPLGYELKKDKKTTTTYFLVVELMGTKEIESFLVL